MTTPNPPLEEVARRAAGGDRDALETVVRTIQDPVYRLALRMLSDPHDAEDATQEILVQVVTHLSSFEGRSKLTTWVYRIASRALLRTRKRAVEQSVRGPEAFSAWLDGHVSAEPYTASSEAEFKELCEEVRIGCTYGMLLCLSRELRLAYILGDLLELTDREGAEALEITPAAFRQRVARARQIVRPIIAARCGVVEPGGTCQCSRQIKSSIALGLVKLGRPTYASLPRAEDVTATPRFQRAARQLDVAERFAEVFRSDPAFAAPTSVAAHLRAALPDLLG